MDRRKLSSITPSRNVEDARLRSTVHAKRGGIPNKVVPSPSHGNNVSVYRSPERPRDDPIEFGPDTAPKPRARK